MIMTDDFNKLIDSANANKNFNMPQFNPADYPSLACDKCGCVAFQQALIMKKVPGVLVGSSSEFQLIPDYILTCAKCGTILKKDREYYKLNDDNTEDASKFENKATDNSGLII